MDYTLLHFTFFWNQEQLLKRIIQNFKYLMHDFFHFRLQFLHLQPVRKQWTVPRWYWWIHLCLWCWIHRTVLSVRYVLLAFLSLSVQCHPSYCQKNLLSYKFSLGGRELELNYVRCQNTLGLLIICKFEYQKLTFAYQCNLFL